MKNVLEFNLKRNQLKLNSSLEVNMLREEIQEFYDAETLAERIDAMVDVRYVYEGTQLKHNYHMLPMSKDITTVVGEFHRISSTIVSQELGDDAQYLDKIMTKAWDIVCEINAMKVSELDENGKVVKQKNLPDATEHIDQLLASMLTDAGE